MEIFFVYLWMQLPMFFNGAIAFLCLATFLSVAWTIAASEGRNEGVTRQRTTLRNSWFAVALATGVFAIVLPGQGTVAAMVGTYYAKEAINSVEGQKVMTLIRKKANEYLDAELNKK